jgi:hypothetical protein
MQLKKLKKFNRKATNETHTKAAKSLVPFWPNAGTVLVVDVSGRLNF